MLAILFLLLPFYMAMRFKRTWVDYPFGTSRVFNQVVSKLRQIRHHEMSQEYQRERERELVTG